MKSLFFTLVLTVFLLPASLEAAMDNEQTETLLINLIGNMRSEINGGRVIRGENNRLQALSDDTVLQEQVNTFNTQLNLHLQQLREKYHLSNEKLESLLIRSYFANIPKTSTFTPDKDVKKTQRYMVLDKAIAYEADSGKPNEGTEVSPRLQPTPLSVYYAHPESPNAGRIRLFSSPTLEESRKIGWVDAKSLLPWNHNMVLQFRNPVNRKMAYDVSTRKQSSDGEHFTPYVCFFGSPQEVVNRFEGSEDMLSKLINCQTKLGAFKGRDASYDQEKSYVRDQGVKLALDDQWNNTVFLPITGFDPPSEPSYATYRGLDTRVHQPYQVTLLMAGSKPSQEEDQDRGQHEEETPNWQIYIVMDLSGSMEEFIESIKSSLKKDLTTLSPELQSKLRFGFLGYRDLPRQGKKVIEGFKFHGRGDGLSEENKAYYDYTHAGLLPLNEFVTLLDQVKTAKGEIATLGLSKEGEEKAKRDIDADDMPECLFSGLEEAINSPHWNVEESSSKTLKMILLVGDAPDKETKESLWKKKAELLRSRQEGRGTGILLTALYIHDEGIEFSQNRQNRDTGASQFKTLSPATYIYKLDSKKGSRAKLPKTAFEHLLSGQLKRMDELDEGIRSGGNAGEVGDKIIKKNEERIRETNDTDIKQMLIQQNYVFSKAVISLNDNKCLHAYGENDAPSDADVSGTRQYWVSEYDPLVQATVPPIDLSVQDDSPTLPDNVRTFDRYVLLTRRQLEKVAEFALSLVQITSQQVHQQPDESIMTMQIARVFCAAGYSTVDIEARIDANAFADELRNNIAGKLPFKSTFVENYIEFLKTGNKDTIRLPEELQRLKNCANCLYDLSKNPYAHLPETFKDGIKLNRQDGKAEDESQQLILIPADFLP